MRKQQSESFLDGQLDLFSISEEPVSLPLIEETSEILPQEIPPQEEDIVSNKTLSEEVYRPFASVQVGEHVQIGSPIDTSPEAIGYFDYHKGRKGTVINVVENKKPLNENYQFYATVLFKNGEEGIFYDLELIIIN